MRDTTGVDLSPNMQMDDKTVLQMSAAGEDVDWDAIDRIRAANGRGPAKVPYFLSLGQQIPLQLLQMYHWASMPSFTQLSSKCTVQMERTVG